MPNGLLPSATVCALPPMPPKTNAVSAASPDDTSIVVTVRAAAANGGTVAQLGATCTIKNGATSYTLSAAAPATAITFAPGGAIADLCGATWTPSCTWVNAAGASAPVAGAPVALPPCQPT